MYQKWYTMTDCFILRFNKQLQNIQSIFSRVYVLISLPTVDVQQPVFSFVAFCSSTGVTLPSHHHSSSSSSSSGWRPGWPAAQPFLATQSAGSHDHKSYDTTMINSLFCCFFTLRIWWGHSFLSPADWLSCSLSFSFPIFSHTNKLHVLSLHPWMSFFLQSLLWTCKSISICSPSDILLFAEVKCFVSLWNNYFHMNTTFCQHLANFHLDDPGSGLKVLFVLLTWCENSCLSVT